MFVTGASSVGGRDAGPLVVEAAAAPQLEEAAAALAATASPSAIAAASGETLLFSAAAAAAVAAAGVLKFPPGPVAPLFATFGGVSGFADAPSATARFPVLLLLLLLCDALLCLFLLFFPWLWLVAAEAGERVFCAEGLGVDDDPRDLSLSTRFARALRTAVDDNSNDGVLSAARR
eukprot:COSAG06_NODE_1479_length_9323_cov_16.105269_2_plen_176_part_00